MKTVIVLGCNHSGTRAIVSILQKLGGYGGICTNHWGENDQFLAFHKLLMKIEFGSDRWFDLNTFSNPIPRGKYSALCKEFLDLYNRTLHYNIYFSYWKCPRSIYFLDAWKEVTNNVLFVHIIRDGRDVAVSLRKSNKRSYIPNDEYALRYWGAYLKYLAPLLPSDCLTIRYEDLKAGVNKIAYAIGISDKEKLQAAYDILKPNVGSWKKEFIGNPKSTMLIKLGYNN